MSKIPKRKKAQRRQALAPKTTLLALCINCGEKGPHYYPPGFGSPGGWMCKKKEEPMTDDGLFEQLEDAIMSVRDAYPRRPDDAPSSEVAEAVMKVLVKEKQYRFLAETTDEEDDE